MLNVLVVGYDGILRTPPFKHILRGCTVRRCGSSPPRSQPASDPARRPHLPHRCLELAEKLTEDEYSPPPLRGIAQEAISVSDLYAAREVSLPPMCSQMT